MGYTHYYPRPKELNAERFLAFSNDVKKLLEHLPEHSLSAGGYYKEHPIIIRGWDGTGEPSINADLVSFNGDDEGGEDLAHETFSMPRVLEPQSWQKPDGQGVYFTFCKTARKPYDLLVCVALMAYKKHFPTADIDSDGGRKDWMPATLYYIEVMEELPPPGGPWPPLHEQAVKEALQSYLNTLSQEE